MRFLFNNDRKSYRVYRSVDVVEARVLLSGVGQIQVIDAGDVGYSQSGAGWYELSNNGYPALNGDFRFHHAGAGTALAQWEFTSISPGWYDVATTWVGQHNRTASATYQIVDGLQFEATVSINQKVPPTGDYWDTQRWESLGRYYVSEGKVSVQLNSHPGGIIVADAIRLVRLPNVELTADGTGHPMTWSSGTLPQVTFTLGRTHLEKLNFTNQSAQAITFRAVSSIPEHVQISSGAHWTTVPAGATTEVSYTLSASETGTIHAEVFLEIAGKVTSKLPWQVTATVVENSAPPQLSVRQLDTGNVLGENSFHFRDSFQNELATTTFQFRNDGTSLISLSPNVHVPTGFEILDSSGSWNSEMSEALLPEEPLAPGESFLLTLRTSASTGAKTGVLVLNSSDNVLLTSIQLLGTTHAGYVLDEPTSNGWLYRSRAYFNSYNQDFLYAYPSWSPTTSQWEIRDLPDGEYRIWTTWLPGENRVTDATYTVRSGESIDYETVNQRQQPNSSGPLLNWQLITTIRVTNGHVTVQLSNQASHGIVVADAVWIEPVSLLQPEQYLIDDGDPGYTENGVGWFERTAAWFPSLNHDIRYAGAHWSATTAQWTFDSLGTGTWEVFASWVPGSNRAIDATYSVASAGSMHQAVINQQQAPDDLFVEGNRWTSLGTVTLQTGDALSVSLSNAASSGLVIADAILVRKIVDATSQPLSLVLNDSHFRSGDTLRIATSTNNPGEYQFWLKSAQGWELVQTGTNSVWETALDHGTYQVRVDFRSENRLAIASQTLDLTIHESKAELWSRIITPYLEDELWNFDLRYDAANFLMIPLVDAFQMGNIERQLEFKQHFARITAHGADSNGEQGDLSWLQYLSLASRFVSEAARAGREELIEPELLDLLYSELNRYWIDAPAFHFAGPAFVGMQQRLEWKLTVDPTTLVKSYYNAIIDHETFVMSLAAHLKTYERLSAQQRSGSVIDDVLAVTRSVFEQRGLWQGKRWLFQIGYWDDHIDFAYAGRAHVSENLSPAPLDNVAPDSAHAHRIPELLNSLIHALPEDGFYQTILAGAEQQFFEKVLVSPTSDFDGYRLTNYMDGRNGVYRYGTLLGTSDGYDAYELSGRLLYGWWTFLDSDRIRSVYREIADSFNLSSDVEATYTGPLDLRQTHPLTKLPAAYGNGFLELTTLIAGRVRSSDSVE